MILNLINNLKAIKCCEFLSLEIQSLQGLKFKFFIDDIFVNLINFKAKNI